MSNEQNQPPKPSADIICSVILDKKLNQVRVLGPIHERGMLVKMLATAIQIVVDAQVTPVAINKNGATIIPRG